MEEQEFYQLIEESNNEGIMINEINQFYREQ